MWRYVVHADTINVVLAPRPRVHKRVHNVNAYHRQSSHQKMQYKYTYICIYIHIEYQFVRNALARNARDARETRTVRVCRGETAAAAGVCVFVINVSV